MKFKDIYTSITFVILFLSLIILNGCAIGRDTISIEYPIQNQILKTPILGAEHINVDVVVYDQRMNTNNLGCKGFGLDVEEVGIELKDNLFEIVSNAIKFELNQRNFNLSKGNNLIEVIIIKFHNDFKCTGFLNGKILQSLFYLFK